MIEVLLGTSLCAITLMHTMFMMGLVVTGESIYIVHKILLLLTGMGAMIVYYRLYNYHVQHALYIGLMSMIGVICLMGFVLVAGYTMTLGGIVFLILYYGCIYIGIYESTRSAYIHTVHTDGIYRSSMYMTMLSCLGVAAYIAVYP
jgi:hypothetical protein